MTTIENKNIADILHDTAMEYYDLGKIAKAKGKLSVYEDYLHRAYALDKEAAIKQQHNKEDTFWKYVYLRSASWLAVDCKKWEEAKNLAEFGLQGTPPPTEKKQFQEILQIVYKNTGSKTSKTKQDSKIQQFIGVLTSVDSSNSFIIVNGGQPSALKIWVKTRNIDDLVKMFWGEPIFGSGILKESGELELAHIQKAA